MRNRNDLAMLSRSSSSGLLWPCMVSLLLGAWASKPTCIPAWRPAAPHRLVLLRHVVDVDRVDGPDLGRFGWWLRDGLLEAVHQRLQVLKNLLHRTLLRRGIRAR